MELLVNTPINDLGYGVVGKNICLALERAGCKVSLFPVMGRIDVSDKDPFIHMAKNAQFFSYDAPSLKIWHQHDMTCFPGRGLKIGLPIFELDTFSPLEKHHLAYPDRLFVCSDWGKTVVSLNYEDKNRVDTTKVVPLGVDKDIFYPSPILPGQTTFYHIGKAETRKGLDVLIRAFKEEFTSNENVCLLLACSNPFLNERQWLMWENQWRGCPNIHFVPKLPKQTDVAELMRTADCGVFPAKAEGWNLEALETLACGRHLIITNYSAHTQYATKDNADLIDISSLEPAYDNIWGVFHGQGNWACIDDKAYQQLRWYMRSIHETKQQNKLDINHAGVETAKNFSWDNTASKILEYIK